MTSLSQAVMAEGRAALVRRGLRLGYVTVIYNSLEAVVVGTYTLTVKQRGTPDVLIRGQLYSTPGDINHLKGVILKANGELLGGRKNNPGIPPRGMVHPCSRGVFFDELGRGASSARYLEAQCFCCSFSGAGIRSTDRSRARGRQP